MKSKLFAATFAAVLAGGLATPALADEEGKVEAAANAVGEAVDDATLVARIKSSLLRSPEVEGLDVNVDAKDGVVTLSGTAATQTEKASAERIAKTQRWRWSVSPQETVMLRGCPRRTPRDGRSGTLSNRAPPMRLDLSDRQRETMGVALTILAACVIVAAVGFVFWLLAAGCGLLLVVMATLIQFSGGPTTGTYHPPVIEDGVIKPADID